jgi:tRNA U34 5-carboxymethylaminomethyl modifying GTPase MnmE/TrmE
MVISIILISLTVMQLIGTNIYANFKIDDIPKGVSNKVRAVLMGHCGSGKTYLFNNLCNTNYDMGISEGTLTRDIACEDVTYFPQNFRIYDTPGTTSELNTLVCA